MLSNPFDFDERGKNEEQSKREEPKNVAGFAFEIGH